MRIATKANGEIWKVVFGFMKVVLSKKLLLDMHERPKSKKCTAQYFYERVIKSFLKATYCGIIHKLRLYFLLLHDYMTSTVRVGATEQNAKDMKGHSHTITIPPRVHSQACG